MLSGGLLLIERIVIESLVKKELSFKEIENETAIQEIILGDILESLMRKKIVINKFGIFKLNTENMKTWDSQINQPYKLKEEIKEVVVTMVNKAFHEKKSESQLKLQKIWLTQNESLELNEHLLKIERFFNNIKLLRANRPEKEKLHEQKVVLWGVANYSEIVKGVFESV